MEKTKNDLPIQVNLGDRVIWVQDIQSHNKFKLHKFVQVDCKSGIKNGGDDPHPFTKESDDDEFEKNKTSPVSSKAKQCSCFKHVITFDDNTKIDPHVIIGPGSGLKDGTLECPVPPKNQKESQREPRKRGAGTLINPTTCINDGTCQDCPEPKSDSLCEISTEWLRKDSHDPDHLPLLLHQNQEVIWYTPLKHATINVDDFSEVDCSDEKRLIRKKVKDVVKMKTGTPAPAQLGFIGGKVGSCYKHNIIGSGGGETGVDPHVIIGPGIQ